MASSQFTLEGLSCICRCACGQIYRIQIAVQLWSSSWCVIITYSIAQAEFLMAFSYCVQLNRLCKNHITYVPRLSEEVLWRNRCTLTKPATHKHLLQEWNAQACVTPLYHPLHLIAERPFSGRHELKIQIQTV